MKHESKATGAKQMSSDVDGGLRALLIRLDALSRQPLFQAQRDRAMGLALRPYTDESGRLRGLRWPPLVEEMNLALLYVFADYFPDDGQLSLIEQIRDTIDVHVPEGERIWLDPLKHSSMDLLEVVDIEESDDGVTLRSLGDGQTFRVTRRGLDGDVHRGQVLLTRLIRLPDRTVPAGAALALSAGHARDILDMTHQWQREMEAESGSFALGEWPEFTKRYGYVLLWMFAQARLDAMLKADDAIDYRTADGQPFLYALAMYEHAAYRRLADGISAIDKLEAVDGDASRDRRVWVQRESGRPSTGSNTGGLIVVRLALTPTQLTVECDSGERLNTVKHQLASEFGFALHFRGEATTLPVHDIPTVDFEEERLPAVTIAVTREEELRLLRKFLESIYLEWADRASPALDNVTPRHAAALPATRGKVTALIEEMERNDVASRRIGTRGYDYNILRRHVGVPETNV